MRQVFEYESVIASPADAVFSFHQRPDALSLLIPPGQPIRILEQTGGICNGARVVISIGLWPLEFRWIARHQGFIEGRQFQDVQESGPFIFWEHTHTVIGISSEKSLLRDHIEYEVPFEFILNRFVQSQLRKTFAYRHRITAIHTT